MDEPGTIPDLLAPLVLQACREHPDKIDHEVITERPVYVRADFRQDGRYLGYTILIRIGTAMREFEVRGPMTMYRHVPKLMFMQLGPDGIAQLSRIEEACRDQASEYELWCAIAAARASAG